jgi:protein-disulfide isomerase
VRPPAQDGRPGITRRNRARPALVTAAVLLIAVVATLLVQGTRTATGAGIPVPRNTAAGTDGAGFAVGSSTAPVTVDVYEDFLCPICRRFEEQTGGMIAQLVADGTVRVRYRPLAFLDRLSTDDYSTRALNAAAVVADAAGSAP